VIVVVIGLCIAVSLHVRLYRTELNQNVLSGYLAVIYIAFLSVVCLSIFCIW